VVAADLLPDIRDVGGQALLGEELHPISGAPGENVVRRAPEVAVDVLLEGVVVDGVDPYAGLCELLDNVGERLLRLLVVGVGAQGDGAEDGAGGGLFGAAAGGEHGGHAGSGGCAQEQVAAGDRRAVVHGGSSLPDPRIPPSSI